MCRSQNAGSWILPCLALLPLLLAGCQTSGRVTVHAERYGSPVAYEHALHGELAAEQGNFDMAVRHFKQALAADPHDPYLRVRLATTMVKTGAPEAARRHIEKVLKTDPQDKTVRRALTKYYEAVGDKEKAAPRQSTPH